MLYQNVTKFDASNTKRGNFENVTKYDATLFKKKLHKKLSNMTQIASSLVTYFENVTKYDATLLKKSALIKAKNSQI